MKRLLALMALVALVGCATKEGVAIPTSQPTQADVSGFNQRNAAPVNKSQQPAASAQVGNGQHEVVKSSLVPDVEGAKLIIVGNTMALTAFDAAALEQRYENYLKQLGGKPPVIPRNWYMASGSGETAIKYSGVTGIYTRFYRAEVPKDLVRQISFASAFGTFMAGTSADLVAAQVLPGYGSWVTHVLCSEKDANYDACAQQYRAGVYQSSDGQEVDTSLKLVPGGASIDPLTFKLRAGATAQNAARAGG